MLCPRIVKRRGVDTLTVHIDRNLKFETLNIHLVVMTVRAYFGQVVKLSDIDSADYILASNQDVAQVSCVCGC